MQKNHGGPPKAGGSSAAAGVGSTKKAVVMKDGYKPALGGSKMPHPDTDGYKAMKAANDGSTPGETARCM